MPPINYMLNMMVINCSNCNKELLVPAPWAIYFTRFITCPECNLKLDLGEEVGEKNESKNTKTTKKMELN